MRITIATWSRRLAGGVESYLSRLVPALLDLGHDVSLLHEVDVPVERALVTTSPRVPCWSVEKRADEALGHLRAWRPDVIFVQGLEDPAIEGRLLTHAPAVFFAHVYRGTCVSGTKSFAAGGITPCTRMLGPGCLVQFFPKRCGGLNPLTMAGLYRRESRRRDLFPQYEAVVAFSGHIEAECLRHGVPPGRTFRLPAPVSAPQPLARVVDGSLPSRILFIGRMEALKGGQVLLEALPCVERALDRGLDVTFVGEGRLTADWKRQAAALFPSGSRTSVTFTGWVDGKDRDRLLLQADLLVVPSLWPEPFGLIGVEAGACGVPAAGFDVGGIREWLKDGVNGHLAAPTWPRAGALASAIVECLRDPVTHARLSTGAVETASHHTMDAHTTALLRVLSAAASRSVGNAGDAA